MSRTGGKHETGGEDMADLRVPIALDGEWNVSHARDSHGLPVLRFRLAPGTVVTDVSGEVFDAGYWRAECPARALVDDGLSVEARGFARLLLPEHEPRTGAPAALTLRRDYADVDDDGVKRHETILTREVEVSGLARATQAHMASRLEFAQRVKRAKELVKWSTTNARR